MFVVIAMGEATLGATVQKAGAVAASKQDVYASESHDQSHDLV